MDGSNWRTRTSQQWDTKSGLIVMGFDVEQNCDLSARVWPWATVATDRSYVGFHLDIPTTRRCSLIRWLGNWTVLQVRCRVRRIKGAGETMDGWSRFIETLEGEGLSLTSTKVTLETIHNNTRIVCEVRVFTIIFLNQSYSVNKLFYTRFSLYLIVLIAVIMDFAHKNISMIKLYLFMKFKSHHTAFSHQKNNSF